MKLPQIVSKCTSHKIDLIKNNHSSSPSLMRNMTIANIETSFNGWKFKSFS